MFYLQNRVGKNGKLFKLIKFATMLKNSPNIGSGTITLENDERILPIGKFLRKTKINELPQLFNVLLGNMSLIAPRNSESQINMALREKKKNEPLRRGMIVFWKGHVGIMRDPFNIIHANAYHMKVCSEPLITVEKRMGKSKIKKILIF